MGTTRLMELIDRASRPSRTAGCRADRMIVDVQTPAPAFPLQRIAISSIHIRSNIGQPGGAVHGLRSEGPPGPVATPGWLFHAKVTHHSTGK